MIFCRHKRFEASASVAGGVTRMESAELDEHGERVEERERKYCTAALQTSPVCSKNNTGQTVNKPVIQHTIYSNILRIKNL